MRSVSIAKSVLKNEAEAILKAIPRLKSDFDDIIDLLINIKGRVIVTGMGKPGFIAQKVSATMASTGTPSLYLHPAEALHGDLGRVTKNDVIIAFSNSGETEEVIRLLPIIKKIGAKLIAVTANKKSTLANNSDFVLDSKVPSEACPMGLAPTTSTTLMLAIGDAVAVALLKKKDFKPKDFALFHPGGALGKRLLLKVEDIMRCKSKVAIVKPKDRVKSVLVKITKLKAGSATVLDKKGKILGIFTDGDLRRHLEEEGNILDVPIEKVMTLNPCSIKQNRLAAEAMDMMKSKKIDEMPVVDSVGKLAGILDIQDIIDAGLV